jgi:DNA-binding transcriptional regulator YdaS (Cro superfamily)
MRELTTDKGILRAIEAAGGLRALARKLNITHQRILRWHKIPSDWLLQVEEVTNVPREKLRPDIFIGYSRNDVKLARKVVIKEAIRQL